MNKNIPIIWLASYPKSGNTWLRFFLYRYLYGIPKNSLDIGNKIPDIHVATQFPATVAGMILCKTHFTLSGKHPFRGNTSGFIYIARNPKDIVQSSYNFCKYEGSTDKDFESFARDFAEHKGFYTWQKVGFGSLDEHASSWLDNKMHPRLCLRYEDMLVNPEGEFTKVLNFLQIDIDKGKLTQALNDSSFKRMKATEIKEKKRNIQGIFYPVGSPGVDTSRRFMNKGQKKQSLLDISPELDALFDESFAEYRERFGYV